MNVKRGLIRVWVVLSGLWIIAVAVLAYLVLWYDRELGGEYQWVANIKSHLEISKIDWSRPYYEIIVSPSQNPQDLVFSTVESKYLLEWNKSVRNGQRVLVNFPDYSKLYLSAELTKEDQAILTEEFWDQRWGRWFERVWPWFAAAVVVPLAVLGIGGAVYWAVMGFARS